MIRTLSREAAAAAPMPRLLIVDDQPVNIQVLYRVFAADHQVLMATSGAKALEICRETLPDLVLLDVMMPEMDGFEVLRRLKADPQTAHIPVIFVTALDAVEDETHGLTLGAVDFIGKPIKPAIVRARVLTHLELARARALLGATLDATADGIAVFGTDGSLLGCNQRFANMWHIPKELVAAGDQMAIMEYIHTSSASDGAALALFGAGAAEAGESETVLELQDGRVLQVSQAPLHAHGDQDGRVLSFSDVTDRVRAERALESLNLVLEAKVQERTMALREALTTAADANRAKSDFLSNMSHELRTPLNAILILSETLLEQMRGPLNERQQASLRNIESSGRHLLDLVNDILDLAKVEAGRMELACETRALAEVCEEGLAVVRELAVTKGVRLGVRVPAPPAAIHADPLRLRQILVNLLSNAVKFTGAGGQVTLSADLEETRGTVRFAITDTGIGITPDNLRRLFTPFTQIDASLDRRHEGTGLGLALVKRLTELHGGHVDVTSTPGRGSCFTVVIPSRGPAAGSAKVAWQARAPLALTAEAVIAGTILLVDDDPTSIDALTGYLQDRVSVLQVARNGDEALALAASERPDVVLMDIRMPGMDGLEAMRRLRRMPACSNVPIIAVTGLAMPGDRETCLAAGADEYFTKPFPPLVLLAAIRRLVCGGARPS
jgi:signal transduction histidine kinase